MCVVLPGGEGVLLDSPDIYAARSPPGWARFVALWNVQCQSENVYLLRGGTTTFVRYHSGMYAQSCIVGSAGGVFWRSGRNTFPKEFALPLIFAKQALAVPGRPAAPGEVAGSEVVSPSLVHPSYPWLLQNRSRRHGGP